MVRGAVVLTVTLAGLVTGCGSATTQPEPAADPPPAATATYAPGLTEDVYLPDDTGPAPLVVLVPGGGWTTADPAGLAGLAARLADRGVVAATTRIRAATDDVLYPVPVEDVLCAAAAAAAHARSHGFAPTRVAVLGHSSGAHLAALAVLAYDDYHPDCASPIIEPDALVGLSGPYDIARVPDLAVALLGVDPTGDPDLWAAANAVRRARMRPTVPVLLMHGDADPVVPVTFTTAFGGALESAGHPTTVEIVPGADHDTIYTADVSGDRIAAWLDSDATASP